jgi:hypothetical protein
MLPDDFVLQEFLNFCLEYPVLLRPPLELQYVLRKATFGGVVDTSSFATPVRDEIAYRYSILDVAFSAKIRKDGSKRPFRQHHQSRHRELILPDRDYHSSHSQRFFAGVVHEGAIRSNQSREYS